MGTPGETARRFQTWKGIGVFFVHYRTKQHGALTLALKEVPGTTDPVLKVGYAFCSPRDQFSRKKGRQIAMGRLRAWLLIPPSDDRYEIGRQFLRALREECFAYDRVDPSPRQESWVPRWFPEFLRSLEQERKAEGVAPVVPLADRLAAERGEEV